MVFVNNEFYICVCMIHKYMKLYLKLCHKKIEFFRYMLCGHHFQEIYIVIMLISLIFHVYVMFHHSLTEKDSHDF